MSTHERFWIGLDMGGTKLLSIVVDDGLRIIGRAKQLVGERRDNDSMAIAVVECIDASLRDAGLDRTRLSGIGTAFAGFLDIHTDVITFTPNLRLTDFPLRALLTREFAVPARVDNDANAGLYGEFSNGAAQGSRNVIGIFIGTGVGGGVIINGHLYVGSDGNAAEIGHMIIQPQGHRCSCGKYGCLEAYVSRKSLAKELVALAASGDAPTILARAGTDITAIKSGRYSCGDQG